MDPLKREIRRSTAGDSCDGGISVLYNCLSRYKFVNTHLYYSRQLYNIHIYTVTVRWLQVLRQATIKILSLVHTACIHIHTVNWTVLLTVRVPAVIYVFLSN